MGYGLNGSVYLPESLSTICIFYPHGMCWTSNRSLLTPCSSMWGCPCLWIIGWSCGCLWNVGWMGWKFMTPNWRTASAVGFRLNVPLSGKSGSGDGGYCGFRHCVIWIRCMKNWCNYAGGRCVFWRISAGRMWVVIAINSGFLRTGDSNRGDSPGIYFSKNVCIMLFLARFTSTDCMGVLQIDLARRIVNILSFL